MKPSELAPTLHRLAELLAVVRAIARDASAQAAKLCATAEWNQSVLAESLRSGVDALRDVAEGCSCPDATEKLRAIADRLLREPMQPAAAGMLSTTARELSHPHDGIIENATKVGAIEIDIDNQSLPTSPPKFPGKERQRRDAKAPSDEPRSEQRRASAIPEVERRKCIDPNCTWIGALPASAKCPTCGKSTIKLR